MILGPSGFIDNVTIIAEYAVLWLLLFRLLEICAKRRPTFFNGKATSMRVPPPLFPAGTCNNEQEKVKAVNDTVKVVMRISCSHHKGHLLPGYQ